MVLQPPEVKKSRKKARLMAFYLPQFHPIPENDKWWGKGFTEWTNVAKARPLFKGHKQPNLPGELGFYDLRLPETRIAQAELAREYGIEGFCYWHYWFGNGKRLLERPFKEVLETGKPDFPFCLAWANHSWLGKWHDAPNKILFKQEYPGRQDYIDHFYSIIDAFKDDRYITIDGKPVFVVFHPADFPNSNEFIDIWRNLAHKVGFKGIYFIGISHYQWQPEPDGFDACCVDYFSTVRAHLKNRSFAGKVLSHFYGKDFGDIFRGGLFRKPAVFKYADVIKHAFHSTIYDDNQYPCIIPNWDNTPRAKHKGVVYQGSTPELFRKHLKDAIRLIDNRPADKRIIFIKSWNEWAEGNYVEPGRDYGRDYLRAIKAEL